MPEPNRLRDAAPPNTYRAGIAHRAASRGQAVRQRSTSVSPPKQRSKSRRVFIGGLLVAFIGVPLFFGPGLHFAEAGIGLICLGLGVAVTSSAGGFWSMTLPQLDARRLRPPPCC